MPPPAAIAKVTSKGQITMPESVRRFLCVQEGDRLLFTIDGDRVRIERLAARVPSSEVFGRLHRPGMAPLDVEQARTKAKAARAQHYRSLGAEEKGSGGE